MSLKIGINQNELLLFIEVGKQAEAPAGHSQFITSIFGLDPELNARSWSNHDTKHSDLAIHFCINLGECFSFALDSVINAIAACSADIVQHFLD